MTRRRLTVEEADRSNAVTLRAAYKALFKDIQEAMDVLIRIDDLHDVCREKCDDLCGGVCCECQDAWPCATSRIANEVLA